MEQKVIYQIKDLNHAIMRYSSELKLTKENLPTPAQMQIIHYMCQRKGQTIYQRDIAKALGLRRATLSEILKTMEKNNLISKIADKNDTRIKEVILNATAEAKFQTVKKALESTEKTLIKSINENDLEIFCHVIEQMRENLKNERMNIC